MAFRVLIIGGAGQVGGAVMRALAAEPSCAEIVMVNRRAASANADRRVRQVTLDTADAGFSAEVAEIARGMVTQGDPVYGASCVGVGQGSMKWSEDALKALEIGVIEQDDIGRAFAAEFANNVTRGGTIYLGNDAMRRSGSRSS